MTTRTEFEDRFSETGRNIDEMVADTREELREERQELRNKWDTLEARRSEVKDDSMWENVKDEMEEGWNDLKESYEDLKHRFSGDHKGHNH